jgi:hypothetical protein
VEKCSALLTFDGHTRPAWDAGRQLGPKRALEQKEAWATSLSLERRLRDRAFFDLASDSKCALAAGPPRELRG